MLKLRRTESMNIEVRIFCAHVLQKINVLLEWQFRMMPALHQNLNSARGSEFIQLLIELLDTKHVRIFVVLGSVKRAEFAVNVAAIRVMDVAIVGAGVSGLTCGVILAERGYRTAIFAKETGKQTTSGAAAAVWCPYDARPAKRVIPWALETYQVLAELARMSASGVSMIEL